MMDIIVRKLSKAFGENRVLRELDLVFPQGTRTCIMGPSGCGKTTLLRILMGLEAADSGTISGLEGARLSAVFQEDRLCESFSARANVGMVCTDAAAVAAHLAAVGLEQSMTQPVRELSGGMKRRVAIVRAVLAEKDALFLDEPLKGLDEAMREQIAAYLREHTRGVTTVMVTHDPEEVGLMEARLVRLERERQDEN